MPIKEFYLDRVLKELELNQDEFIDLCILLGCDYCDSIRGIGPKRAMELIRQHKNIEAVIRNLDQKLLPLSTMTSSHTDVFIDSRLQNRPAYTARLCETVQKYPLPEDWPYEEARMLFKKPEVIDPEMTDIKWTEPDEDELVKFMVTDKGFNEERIRNGIKKLEKAKTGTTQGRLDSFFKVVNVTSTSTKRKGSESKGPEKKKAKNNSSFKRPK